MFPCSHCQQTLHKACGLHFNDAIGFPVLVCSSCHSGGKRCQNSFVDEGIISSYGRVDECPRKNPIPLLRLRSFNMFLISVVMMRVEVNGENKTYFGMNEKSVEKNSYKNGGRNIVVLFLE